MAGRNPQVRQSLSLSCGVLAFSKFCPKCRSPRHQRLTSPNSCTGTTAVASPRCTSPASANRLSNAVRFQCPGSMEGLRKCNSYRHNWPSEMRSDGFLVLGSVAHNVQRCSDVSSCQPNAETGKLVIVDILGPLAGRQEVVGGAVLAGSLGKRLLCSHILLVPSVEGRAVQALFTVQDTMSDTDRFLSWLFSMYPDCTE